MNNPTATGQSSKGATAWLGLSFVIIALDQVSKWAIVKWVELYRSIPVSEFLDITYLRNRDVLWQFLI